MSTCLKIIILIFAALTYITYTVGCAATTYAQPDTGVILYDISSPESTVIGFTIAAANRQAKTAQSYFLPGGEDYTDIYEVLTAQPSSPKYPGRIMLESIDPNSPIKIISQTRTTDNTGSISTKILWQIKFAKPFQIEGQTVAADTPYTFDATLKQTQLGWLIDNF